MNINDQIKMKVLQDLRRHMDGKMGERLKPKKAVELTQVKVEPANQAKESSILGKEQDPSVRSNPGSGLDLPDEDKQRLLDLYSSLK